MELYTIELNKFENEIGGDLSSVLPKIKTGLDRWVAFLTKAYYMDAKRLPVELKDPCLQKAIETLEQIHMTEREREVYEGQLRWFRMEAGALEKMQQETLIKIEEAQARAEAEKARAEAAEAQAEEEKVKAKTAEIRGVDKTKREFVKASLHAGIPLSTISRITGLSEEEITQL